MRTERPGIPQEYKTPGEVRAYLTGEQHAYNEIPANEEQFPYDSERDAYTAGYRNGIKLIEIVG